MNRRTFLLAVAAASTLPSPRSWAGSGEAVAVTLGGRRRNGLPLVWEPHAGLLLGRDGRLWELTPDEMETAIPAGEYRPATAAEVRAELLDELGSQYQVTGTPNYLVASPRSGDATWPATFERLHAAFRRCFQTRGFSLRTGRFPMVAVVAASRDAMLRVARRAGETADGDLLGFYSQLSNRIYLYDHGASQGGVAATICHEAAHQSAFNTGLHTRLADSPRWLVEGVGTVFESPFMAGESRVASLKGQVVYRDEFLDRFAAPPDVAARLGPLLEDDRAFSQSPTDAYALSWALALYLLDRRPAEFRRLLESVARLLPLRAYGAPHRRADFADAVPGDLQMIAVQLHRFISSLG